MYTTVPYGEPSNAPKSVPKPSANMVSAMGYGSPAFCADTKHIIPEKLAAIEKGKRYNGKAIFRMRFVNRSIIIRKRDGI